PPHDWLWILRHYYPRFKVIPSRCDLNNDYTISKDDEQMAIEIALGVRTCTAEADLDNNGYCNIIDVQRIVNATIGKTSCFDSVDETTEGAGGTPVRELRTGPRRKESDRD